MHISAKSDYAVRALLELAAADGTVAVRAEALATAQGMPVKFLENILVDLRRAGLVTSRRGSEGGYRLARPAEEITLASIIRAVDGPLAEVRGERPEASDYDGAAVHLRDVWIAVRASVRSVLESVTLAQVVDGKLPRKVRGLIEDPDAWRPH